MPENKGIRFDRTEGENWTFEVSFIILGVAQEIKLSIKIKPKTSRIMMIVCFFFMIILRKYGLYTFWDGF